MRPDIKSAQLGGIANLALIAPVKAGFVPGADTFTYSRRLEAFFKTLNAIRLGSRESQVHANPFPDGVGRWGILHSFRYALIPPRVGSRGEEVPAEGEIGAGLYRLYLNVVFDGGWEPYMRVIYRDLGYLLDTIFCNCVGYPFSTQHTFDEYCRWVREHEVPAGILYLESAATVMDQRYLEAVERAQRTELDPARARQSAAAYALPPVADIPQALQRLLTSEPLARKEVIANNLRALKGLYDLRTFYPSNSDDDEPRLLRFAKRAMPEFCAFLAGQKNEPWLAPHRESVDWVTGSVADEQPGHGAPARFEPADIQHGIFERYAGVTHGCMLLLQVTDAALACAWLAALPAVAARQQRESGGTLYWNVAFSAHGLHALGQPPEAVDLFPQEFVEGMEARAGALGDVRSNHPEHWRRPRFRNTQVEVDLASVHVVVQYRLATPTEPDQLMHSFLRGLADAVDADRDGLLLLSAEAMRSYGAADNVTREHFGFQDGFSQPTPQFTQGAGAPQGVAAAAPAAAFNDSVGAGELFLGHAGDRDRDGESGRFPGQPNALMDNGSFLVVRKIRQHVGRWQAMLARAAQRQDANHNARPEHERAAARARIAAMLMGRRHDGAVMVDPELGSTNNFNYQADPQGSRCPFQAHIRRANPRTVGQKMPRILRRGMSYGPRWEADPNAERGLIFMAYCGSIAEQFEAIQRWIAGGNSSGVHSSHSDPMLGVPHKGMPRTFQWLGSDGKVGQVDLGDEPLTGLQWGLYLFAPSLTGLQALAQGGAGSGAAAGHAQPALPTSAPAAAEGAASAAARAAPAPGTPAPGTTARGCPMRSERYDPEGPVFEQRKMVLQGRRDDRDKFWQDVVRCGGTLETAYGQLEARKPEALRMLADTGSEHSVGGYGRRFEASVGAGFLGMDDPDHNRLAVNSGIKDRIAQITEPVAFAAAQEEAGKLLAQRLAQAQALQQAPNIDIVRLSEQTIAKLYQRWWGLPDGLHMKVGFSSQAVDDADPAAYCPRDFFFVARHNFGAHPTASERHRGTTRGQAIQSAVRAYLKVTARQELRELSAFIHDQLIEGRDGFNEAVWTIGGTMLGFGPSVHQHFVLVMRDWVEPSRPGPTLWDLQVRLWAGISAAPAAPVSHADAAKVLRAPLIAQMCREPVPGIIWREAPNARLEQAPGRREPPKTVLGLHALMQDPDAEALMFGGTLEPGDLFGVHACPGHKMATGVLMGVVAALLQSGTLRRSPSPTILMLGS